MKRVGVRLFWAGLMALSGTAAFGAARKPAPVVHHSRATHENPVKPGPLVVGWHDEMDRIDQWTPVPPPNSAAAAAPTPGLIELSLTPKPAGYPYPYQWGGVRQIATVDLDRYPVLAVQALRLGPHSYWDVGVQPLNPGVGVPHEVKTQSLTYPGVQFIDLGAAGVKGQQQLEIRLHVGGSIGGYEVADYGWVRFIRRQDRARVQKDPNPAEVLLDTSPAHGATSPAVEATAHGVTSPAVGTTAPAPRPAPVSGITLAQMKILKGHTGPVGAGIEFSPNGAIAILGSSGEDGLVIVWSIPSGTVLRTLPGHLAAGDTAVSFSPDGKLLAAPGADGNVKLWNTSDWSMWKELPGGAAPLAFSPMGGELAASAPDDASVKVWNINSGAVERVIPVASYTPASVVPPASPLIESLCYSPDGTKLATAGADGAVRIWSAQTGVLLSTLRGHLGAVRCLRFSGDGRWLASAGEDQVVRLWPMNGGTPKVLGFAGHLIGSIAFSRDGSVVAAGTEGQILFWRTEDGEPLGLINTSADWINALAFSPDGHFFAAGSRDHSVILWRYSQIPG